MQSLELKYDEQCDCWVLEPFDGSIHSVSKSLPSPSSFSAPSPSCFTSPTTYFTVPSLPKPREGRFLFGKIVVRFWKCFKPRLYSGTAKNDSNGMRPCGGDDSAKTRSGMQSPLQGQHHAEYYSAMSADERDENLKEVIFYCRKSSSTEPTEVKPCKGDPFYFVVFSCPYLMDALPSIPLEITRFCIRKKVISS
ncbi:hypothetical protein ACFX2G_018307 [Malus domestica]